MTFKNFVLGLFLLLLPRLLVAEEIDRLGHLMDQQQLQNSQILRVLEDQEGKIRSQTQSLTEVRKIVEEQRQLLQEQGALQKEILEKLAGLPALVSVKPASNGVNGFVADLRARIRGVEKLLVVSFAVGGLNAIFLLVVLYLLRRQTPVVEKTVRRETTEGVATSFTGKKRHEVKQIAFGRPQLEVQTRQGKLALFNSGRVTADHIRLFMGTTPSTLERRQKMVTTIQAGGRVEIDLSSYPIHEFLYGSVEYRHPANGKLFKDQFILKLHPETGELMMANPVPRLEELHEEIA